MTFPITAAHLAAAGVGTRQIDAFLTPLTLAMIEFGITTGERPAMFIAQLAHESAGFRYTSEVWGPTPAQARYEGRLDLGNTEPGDGARYKGHGLIQVTGRSNHRQMAEHFGVPMEGIVTWLISPTGACRSAGYYWATRKCNAYADAFDFIAVTRAINGGLNGIDDRIERYRKVCAAMA